MIRAFDRDERIPRDGLDELAELDKLPAAGQQALERESKILVALKFDALAVDALLSA